MLIREKIYIKSLKRKREISIYLPDDYQTTDKKYPVLFINDGQNAFFDEESYLGTSWHFIESVQAMNIDIVMVAIPCHFKPLKREDEYGPWVISKELAKEFNTDRKLGGEGKQYVSFLVKQLKPYIDSRFLTNPNDYGIVGSSMGGLISFYAFLRYPRVFKRCAILSTAFWIYEKQFKNMIRFSRIKNNSLYMDVGGNEGDDRYIPSNEAIKKALQGKIRHFEYHYFAYDDHSEASWARRVPYFLKMFYR